MTKKYRYSEIFGGFGHITDNGSFEPGTIQGEGYYTGVPSVWLRVFGCNFNCHGFGQEEPTDPSTWELDFEDIDVSSFKAMEELPVFSKGCDSSYSWAKKFAHLAHQETANEITDKILKRVDYSWLHPKTNIDCHMVFTGGEPILNQSAVVAVMNSFIEKDRIPKHVTIETNGALKIRDEFKVCFNNLLRSGGLKELFWSVSPKIYATSGEKSVDAIKPEILAEYNDLSSKGQLKFVCNGRQQSWDQIDEAIEKYREAGVNWPVWIMPVGATVEGQQLVAADVADQAIYRGYYVAARVHTYLYGNQIGR